MQRENLLAKEAKYEHGLRRNSENYDEVVNALREGNNASRGERSQGNNSPKNILKVECSPINISTYLIK